MIVRLLALLFCVATAACASAGAPAVDEATLTAATERAPIDPPEPDRNCAVDADCAVKNVGNCCGYYPACVNVNAETFPTQVKQACEREGRSSICGFPDIQGCRCVQQRCEAAPTRANEVM